jgi:hypothetical protein
MTPRASSTITALATASPEWCVMLTRTSIPAESPNSLTKGAPEGAASTSIRRRGKQTPVPSKHLITASFAAQRPASRSGLPAQ